MIIDCFAGGGGASTGIEMALGRSPDVAINHSKAALALHAANHPDTLHLESNIWDVDPRSVVKGRKVGLLWASPDCKHFSKAKGGAPRDRNIRDLAWTVVRLAEDVKPDVISMENVEEFVTWGPVDNDGQPIKEFAGQTFDLWVSRLKKAGYKVQWRELRACDYGAPTIRNRWFLVARRDGRPIVWPTPTHGAPDAPEVKRGKRLPWRTAAECIDWTQPCPSIFATKAEILTEHGLQSVRPLADNTMARVARGMKRYVLDAEKPFLVQVGYGERAGQQPRAMDVDAPLGTVVAGGVKHAVVVPSIVGCGGRAAQSRPRGGNEPLATMTAKADACIATATLAPSLLSIKGTARRDMPTDQPHPTVLAGGGHSALVAPYLATMRNSQKPWQGADEPTHTITAGGAGLTLVAPVLTYAQQGGGNRSMTAPHHTICASRKDQNSLFGAFLAQHNGGPNMGAHAGHDPRNPISTIAASGSHQTPVAAFFAKYYGTGDGARTDDPMHTITVKDRFAHAQAELAAPPFSPEHHARARQVADFLRNHGAWDGGDFVTLTINGAEFVVIDIGMRMLNPRELFNAQGFPTDYVIEGVWHGDEWHPFSKSTQVSCCGNSVCPQLAQAIITANCQHLAKPEHAARQAKKDACNG